MIAINKVKQKHGEPPLMAFIKKDKQFIEEGVGETC